jgi:MATE family, multidrug efflux pump
VSDIKTHIRETLRIATPVSIGYLGHILLGVTDSLMVGQLGAIPLAAASLVVHIFSLSIVVALGMTFAITPIVAHSDGEGNSLRAKETLRHGLMINLALGVLLVGMQFLVANLLPLIGQDAEVVYQAQPYLRILGFGFIPFMITMSFKNFIEGLSFTKPGMYIVLSANILNVFGNWLFVYGNLGFPASGLNGAGYSTLIVEVYMAVVMVAYCYRSALFVKYRPLITLDKLNKSLLKRIIKVGAPTSIHYFFEVGSISVFAIMIGWIGVRYLAAHQIAISLASISFMTIFGIASASTIRIGNALGRQEPRDARRAGFVAMAFGGGLMVLFGVCIVLMRDVFPTFFVDDPLVISTASGLLIVAAIFQVADGLQAVGMGTLRGLEDTRVPMTMAFIIYWLVGIPVGYLCGFTFGLGAIGIWLGLLSGLVIAAAMFVYRFHRMTLKLVSRASE